MAFIERKDPVVLNIKLTSKGRELLSSGQLDFKYYALGDSEIDYDFNREVNAVDSEYTAFDSTILRAADKNANLISFIPRNLSGDSYNEMTSVPSTAYQVENQVESLGFFTNNNTEYITDSNHVKQPDAMVYMDNINGGNVLQLLKAPTYGTSGEEPAVGDVLYIKWTYYNHTTGFTVNKTMPKPNLFYRITEIISGTLAGGAVSVRVDRDLPDFGTPVLPYYAGAMIYYNEIAYSGDTILNMTPTDYLDESVLSFLENNQCPTVVFPYWNMSIIFTEEIAGVQASDLKYTQFKNRTLGGFVSYIQNQAPVLKKLGVIHYTNSSPANVYGESFLQNTPRVDIPTIMWHKSPTATLGTTLSPLGSQQLMADLNLYYYDLADSEGFVVGKMFPDLKIFVIEDQELLFAMSYKSNRSWTVPDYTATTGEIVVPAPVGATVTWTVPENNPILGASVVCAEYCHSTTGCWIPFTGSVAIDGALDTGYRITVQNTAYGSETCIWACDFVNCCLTAYKADDQDSFSSYSVDLCGINNPSGCDYYYTGLIRPD